MRDYQLLKFFDNFDQEILNNGSYPKYNIVKFDNYNYEIQIAVAGFGQDDISVETNHNKLYVSGVSEKSETDGEYLHHGLAKRDFKHIFTLSDTSVVNSADIKDGILKISIENVIPEEKRPRKIPIGIPQKTALLTEDKA